MKILVVIAARGGSKGVKYKNIRPLSGKPLIGYSIEQALRWGKARHVVVSTDSHKIRDIARRYGAEAPFIRPKKLAGDNTPKLPVIRHALIESERLFNERYDIVVDLDATAPIRQLKDLDNCLSLFIKKKPTTLFSVVKAHRNPYFNMVEKKSDGFIKLSKKLPHKVVRRQDAPEVYSMNASIYFYSRKFLIQHNHITPFSKRTAVYIMDDLSAFDIDREIDFRFIDFLIKQGFWKPILNKG